LAPIEPFGVACCTSSLPERLSEFPSLEGWRGVYLWRYELKTIYKQLVVKATVTPKELKLLERQAKELKATLPEYLRMRLELPAKLPRGRRPSVGEQ
jgi:hypothetical protein